jgi:hypothetical protein
VLLSLKETVMNDLHSALANERSRTFLTQARTDGLVRLARCCTPHGFAAAVRGAARTTLHWLRQGQLGGYPGACSTC